MTMMWALVALAAFALSALAGPLEDKHGARELYEETMRRHIFSCRKVSQSCSGVPKCCDNMSCYWKDGYSMFKRGVCVACVQEEQSCRGNSNCCEGLQCDKKGDLDVNGMCRPPRPVGDPCVDDTQCQSGRCSDRWYTRGGVCQP